MGSVCRLVELVEAVEQEVELDQAQGRVDEVFGTLVLQDDDVFRLDQDPLPGIGQGFPQVNADG